MDPNVEISSEELSRMERRLAELVGTDAPELGDFATRGLIRTLAEVRRLARENKQLRILTAQYVRSAQPA
jgi:hypothetical protein